MQLRDPHVVSSQMNPLSFTHYTAATAVSTGMIRPSNFMPGDNKWMPSRGFYTRSHNYSAKIAMEQAGKFGDWNSSRPICTTGLAPSRQLNHATLDSAGVEADCVASQFLDVLRARVRRKRRQRNKLQLTSPTRRRSSKSGPRSSSLIFCDRPHPVLREHVRRC